MRSTSLVAALFSTCLLAGVCEPQSAMAQQQTQSTRVFVKGHAPHRAMELLGDVVVEMGESAGTQAALDALKQRAAQQGADAVVEVVVEHVQKAEPVANLTSLPLLMMGSLMSLTAMSPEPLHDLVNAAQQHVIKHPVTLVRGTAVKFLR